MNTHKAIGSGEVDFEEARVAVAGVVNTVFRHDDPIARANSRIGLKASRTSGLDRAVSVPRPGASKIMVRGNDERLEDP